MKRILKFLPLLLVGCVFWSFSSKTSSAVSSSKEQTLQNQPAADSAAIKAGQELYTMKCQKCHRLHKPGEFTQDKWENKVLPKMSKKAKLTDDQLKSIETYLFAFSEDKVKK
jgi:mono/diheme cytochrome c family protein